MNNKKWAVFDMDDVLTDFAQSSCDTLVKLGYPNIPVSSWQNYNINDTYGLSSHKEFIDILISENILSNSNLKVDAFDTLNAFKDAGFNIGILTARGWHPQAEKVTQEYIEEHNLPIDKVVIAGHHYQGKLFYADQFLNSGTISCYVDDSPKHIKDFKNANIHAHLMRTSWIQDHEVEGLTQVHSLIEYKERIFEELKLNQSPLIVKKLKFK